MKIVQIVLVGVVIVEVGAFEVVALVGLTGRYGVGLVEGKVGDGRLKPHPAFQEPILLGRRDRLSRGSSTPRECCTAPTHTSPNSRSTSAPGYLLTPPSGGADPREPVEPKEGEGDGWIGLAIVVDEVLPISDGTSHIESMVFIIRP